MKILLRVAGGVAVVLLFVTANLPAQTRDAWVEGVVKNSAGAALPQAKVTLKDANGNAVVSVLTNDRGIYRMPLVNGGVYEVERAGYLSATKRNVKTAERTSVRLDFVLKPAPQAQLHGGLGAVSFYEGPKFEPGQLKDPSAGGGYSDAASVEESQMVRQYLTPGGPGSAHTGEAPGTGTNVSEKGFEASGAALLAQRDYARATPLYRNAVSRYPRSARLQTGLGVSLYGQGQFPAAVKALCAAAHLAPDDPSVYLLLAEAVQLTPRPGAESSALLKGFATAHPLVAAGRYAYALDLWRSFRLDHDGAALAQARSELERAVALDPALVAAHLQLGIVYDEEKLTSRAMEEYREAVRLNPDLATAHYRLAQDDERAGAKQEAAAELEIYERLRKKQNK